MSSEIIKKNLLDLEYNKNLQYLNTCIVISLTYIIGVFIAFFTKQLIFTSAIYNATFFLFSILFVAVMYWLVFSFNTNLRKIKKGISNLKL